MWPFFSIGCVVLDVHKMQNWSQLTAAYRACTVILVKFLDCHPPSITSVFLQRENRKINFDFCKQKRAKNWFNDMNFINYATLFGEEVDVCFVFENTKEFNNLSPGLSNTHPYANVCSLVLLHSSESIQPSQFKSWVFQFCLPTGYISNMFPSSFIDCKINRPLEKERNLSSFPLKSMDLFKKVFGVLIQIHAKERMVIWSCWIIIFLVFMSRNKVLGKCYK